MIKSQVYAGIALALIGIMLFIIVSPIIYYDSPIGIHVKGRQMGGLLLSANNTTSVTLNLSTSYLVVGYNYTSSPLVVELKNDTASVQPISIQTQNKTVYLDYQFRNTDKANYTLVFYNNASQSQSVYYETVELSFGNLAAYSAISYLELVLFVAGIVVAAVGAFRKPRP